MNEAVHPTARSLPPGSHAAAAATTEALHTKADQLRETRYEWVEGARGTMRSKATALTVAAGVKRFTHSVHAHPSPIGECPMSMNPMNRRPVGRQQPTPPRGAKAPLSNAGLALPHERDESTDPSAKAPDPLMVQAKRDIDAGLVDTDMHATPGLDAKLRERMVPGPGGKPPRSRR
jgi:hypothetical protein